jgi:hypothetical protein
VFSVGFNPSRQGLRERRERARKMRFVFGEDGGAMLPSSHGDLSFLFWFSFSPFRALGFCFVFLYLVFQPGRHRKAAPAITGGVFFFLHLLLKHDLCLFAGSCTTARPLWCLSTSSSSASSSHDLVGL